MNLPGIKNMFRSFQHRNYRLFFFGQSISVVGTWIQRIAMPWLVYYLTGSVFLLGVVGFVGQIPTFVLAPFAGVLIDRWNRYYIMIITQVIAMLQALILSLLFFIDIIEIWHVLVLSLTLGCVNAFDVPARQSFMIEMVEKKEDLSNAIALNSSMVNGARLLGPSIAGLLIAFMGEGICFLLNGLSYLFVIISLLLIKVVPKKKSRVFASVFKELKEGFSYTFGFAPIRSIILLLCLVSLMGMPYFILMPVYVKEILHGNSSTFGFLMGASGLGALLGAFYLASRKSVFGLVKIIPLAAAVFGISLILFSFSRFFLLSSLLMLITGMGMVLELASSNTILQTITDDDKRGRVMSFYTMAYMGTTPFGSLLAGGLAELVGVTNTILIGGISCILGAIIFAINLPMLRKLIIPIYIKLGIIPEIMNGIHTTTELKPPTIE